MAGINSKLDLAQVGIQMNIRSLEKGRYQETSLMDRTHGHDFYQDVSTEPCNDPDSFFRSII